VRALAELGALLLVALVAGFGDLLPDQQAAGREPLHRVVAIGASDPVVGVDRTGPVQAIAAAVAAQALRILDLDRRSPVLRAADDQALVGGLLGVGRAGTMAGFADARLVVVLRVQPEDL